MLEITNLKIFHFLSSVYGLGYCKPFGAAVYGLKEDIE